MSSARCPYAPLLRVGCRCRAGPEARSGPRAPPPERGPPVSADRPGKVSLGASASDPAHPTNQVGDADEPRLLGEGCSMCSSVGSVLVDVVAVQAGRAACPGEVVMVARQRCARTCVLLGRSITRCCAPRSGRSRRPARTFHCAAPTDQVQPGVPAPGVGAEVEPRVQPRRPKPSSRARWSRCCRARVDDVGRRSGFGRTEPIWWRSSTRRWWRRAAGARRVGTHRGEGVSVGEVEVCDSSGISASTTGVRRALVFSSNGFAFVAVGNTGS